jgi:DNA-binding XRE family transcriptional regulator
MVYVHYALVQSAGNRNALLVAVPIYEDPDRASKAFGQRVRELRAREGLSQDGLAHASGIHLTSIGRIERGGREPRLTTIQKLARGLGVEPGELTNGLDDGN